MIKKHGSTEVYLDDDGKGNSGFRVTQVKNTKIQLNTTLDKGLQ